MELLASFLAIVGAFLVTSAHTERRYWGFYCFTIANLLFIYFCIEAQHFAMTGMYIIFTLSSIIGLHNNKDFK